MPRTLAFGCALLTAAAGWTALLLVRRYRVEGASMYPTLRDGERLLTLRWLAGLGRPPRGALVVFSDPERPGRKLLKRLVGLPGERVDLIDGTVLVNGARLAEPYRDSRDLWYGSASYQLGADELLLLGDNRSASRDSRHFGPVSARLIASRAFYRYAPAGRTGRI